MKQKIKIQYNGETIDINDSSYLWVWNLKQKACSSYNKKSKILDKEKSLSYITKNMTNGNSRPYYPKLYEWLLKVKDKNLSKNPSTRKKRINHQLKTIIPMKYEKRMVKYFGCLKGMIPKPESLEIRAKISPNQIKKERKVTIHKYDGGITYFFD